MNVLITVIIPVYNADRRLLDLVKKLDMFRKHYSIEIILIDSESENDTVARVRKSFGNAVTVITIARKDFNHGLTRNLGVEKAGGTYVCFLSQDVALADDRFLARFPRLLRRPRCVAVFGRQLPYPDAGRTEKLNNELYFETLNRYTDNDGILVQDRRYPFLEDKPENRLYWYGISNAFACYRRSFLKDNPFPATMYGEDIITGKRIIRKRLVKIYDRKSTCFHSHQLSLEEFTRRQLLELSVKRSLGIPAGQALRKMQYVFRKKCSTAEKILIFMAIGQDYFLKIPLFFRHLAAN